MALKTIITAPDPRLKKKAQPVASVDADVRQLMDDMLETMYAAPGIGLAAPQVDVLKRVVVLDIDREDTKTGPLVMANPEIVEASDEDATYEEGCLSLPEHYSDVVRPAKVTVRYLDRDGIMLGQRQAAFLVGRVLVGGLDDLGIGHQERASLGVLAVDVEHDDPLQHVDLRGGEADTGRRVHRLQHVVHELAHVGVDGGHGQGLFFEARIGRGDDRLESHGA